MEVEFFSYPGHAGLLLALLFLSNELLLIPLFDHSQNRLTIAKVRSKLYRGEDISLQSSKSIWLPWGFRDGVDSKGQSLILLRVVRIMFRLALLISYFLFELHIDQGKVASSRLYSFTPRGLANPAGFSSVVSAFPIEGMPRKALRGLVPYLKDVAVADRNYTAARVGFHQNYSAWCTATDRNSTSSLRRVFFGIYSSRGPGKSGSLACLNGSESRSSAVMLSYDPDSSSTQVGNVSSVTLHRNVARDNAGVMYEATVNVSIGNADVTGVHEGFVVIHLGMHYLKDISYSMYGLLLNRRRGTVMRLNMPLSFNLVPCCTSVERRTCTSARWLGRWTFPGSVHFCPDGQKIDLSDLQYAVADVQDVGLGLHHSALFRTGSAHDVMRAWLAETPYYSFHVPEQFTSELESRMSDGMFYFSDARVSNATLRTGQPRTHVLLDRRSTLGFLVVLTAFFLYCAVACAVEYHSRHTTGIASDCVTRDAMLGMLLAAEEERGVADNENRRMLPVRISRNTNGDYTVFAAKVQRFQNLPRDK